MKLLLAFLAGIVFSAGLVLSGMTQTPKVLGFLDFFRGNWDPNLALVMVGAILTFGILARLSMAGPKPWYAEAFSEFNNNRLTPKLFVGAVMFGAGWGLIGFCPGPALASLGELNPKVLLFVASMAFGQALHHLLQTALGRRTTRPHSKAAPISE